MKALSVYGRLALVLAVVLAVVLVAACDEEPRADFPNLPGGNPLVPEVALYPFPSDFYLEADPSTATGWRVALPGEALPARFDDDEPDPIPAAMFDGLDGFSIAPIILASLPGGIALESLPDPTVTDATLDDSSPVFLIDTRTWERVPVLAELDQTVPEPPMDQSLILRAHMALAYDTSYVVVLTNRLTTPEGTAHVAGDAFRALRDGTATADPDIEKQRERFVLVNEAIARLNLDPVDVVLAWSFHTRSEQSTVQTFLEMQRLAWAAPVGDYQIDSDATDLENRILRGTFTVPEFLDADGLVVLDGDGLPRVLGDRVEEFIVTIPVTVDEPRPVIVFGHSFFKTLDESSEGAINELCRVHRFSAVATNLGFSSPDMARTVEILGLEIESIDWVVSLNWQKMANFTALAKLVRERLAADITGIDGQGQSFSPLDPAQVHYSGISNGGTFGFAIASTSPAFTRASLVVGGGGLTHFLQRSVWWSVVDYFLQDRFPNPISLQLLMSLTQMKLDPIDGLSYVAHLTQDRYEGLPPLKAQIHMARGDSQVRNVLTEWMARTAGAHLITPSVMEVWGLPTVDASDPINDIDSALYIYDEAVTPSPTTNLPPEGDNGTHSKAARIPALQENWAQFLEHGHFINACGGPCYYPRE